MNCNYFFKNKNGIGLREVTIIFVYLVIDILECADQSENIANFITLPFKN